MTGFYNTLSTRKPNWMPDLEAVIRSWSEKKFAWGITDCCVFCGECIKAMTGNNPFTPFAGYNDRQGALKTLKAKGRGTLPTTLVAVLGVPLHVSKAAAGDIVLNCDKKNPAIGLCVGVDSLFISPDDGLIYVETSTCGKVFKI